MSNFVTVGQTVAEIWRFLGFSKWPKLLPSWIFHVCVWTNHKEHLMVLNVVQNLVGIGYAVLKMRVSMLCEFGLKMPLHAPFGGFWGKHGKRETFAVLSL